MVGSSAAVPISRHSVRTWYTISWKCVLISIPIALIRRLSRTQRVIESPGSKSSRTRVSCSSSTSLSAIVGLFELLSTEASKHFFKPRWNLRVILFHYFVQMLDDWFIFLIDEAYSFSFSSSSASSSDSVYVVIYAVGQIIVDDKGHITDI
jgi:hypothetical protein